MLDEKDLQAIAQLMAQQKKEILEESSANMRVLLEGYVEPKFNLLADGQKTILEALTPKSRVEQLEEEVDLLKTVIRSLSRDVAELKKAQ